MSVTPQSSLPQWVINGLLWACTSLIGLIVGIVTYFFDIYRRKVDAIEGNQKRYATVESVAQLELRVAPLISRTELLSYLKQMREDNEKRNDQMREDRQRMHQENLDSITGVRGDISALREAVKQDVSAVHSRVDELFRK